MHKAFSLQFRADPAILGRIGYRHRRQSLLLGVRFGKLQATDAIAAVHSHMQSPLPQHPGPNNHKIVLLVCKDHSLLPQVTPGILATAEKGIVHHYKIFHFPSSAFQQHPSEAKIPNRLKPLRDAIFPGQKICCGADVGPRQRQPKPFCQPPAADISGAGKHPDRRAL